MSARASQSAAAWRRASSSVRIGRLAGNRAMSERGEHRGQGLDPVRQEEEDDVPRPDPLPGELRAEPPGFPPELGAAETPPPVVEDGGRVRPFPNEAAETLRERHARPPAALAVAPRPAPRGQGRSRLAARPLPETAPSREPGAPRLVDPANGHGHERDLAPNPAQSRDVVQRGGLPGPERRRPPPAPRRAPPEQGPPQGAVPRAGLPRWFRRGRGVHGRAGERCTLAQGGKAGRREVRRRVEARR